MRLKLFSIAVFMIFVSTAKGQVSEIYKMGTGNDPQAFRHTDNFTAWNKITDNAIKQGKINSVYYRTAICTTIANKKTGSVAHPIGKIEIKAPNELEDDGSVTGFLNITALKTIMVDGSLMKVMDTLQQFFHLTTTDRIFSVEVARDYSQIIGTYLSIFDNDISEVYAKKDDETHKTKQEEDRPKKQNEETGELSEQQTKNVFDLIFGLGTAQQLTIHDGDKKQAKLFLTELIQRSCNMSVVDGLYRFDPSLLSITQSIYTSLSNCNAAKKGAYYEIVRKTIANNFRPAFDSRKEIGEW